MLIFRQLFDAASSTYTYLLADAETKEVSMYEKSNLKYERVASKQDGLPFGMVGPLTR